MTEPTQTDDVSMPYWYTSAFHEALQNVPFFQTDANGVRIVNVNIHFYKMVDGVLYKALVPEDMSLPTEWDEVTETGPLIDKARSMLANSLAP
jgi:hypothetical protein